MCTCDLFSFLDFLCNINFSFANSSTIRLTK